MNGAKVAFNILSGSMTKCTEKDLRLVYTVSQKRMGQMQHLPMYMCPITYLLCLEETYSQPLFLCLNGWAIHVMSQRCNSMWQVESPLLLSLQGWSHWIRLGEKGVPQVQCDTLVVNIHSERKCVICPDHLPISFKTPIELLAGSSIYQTSSRSHCCWKNPHKLLFSKVDKSLFCSSQSCQVRFNGRGFLDHTRHFYAVKSYVKTSKKIQILTWLMWFRA